VSEGRETFSKINETADYFGTGILSMFILPRLKSNWKMCFHAIKKLYKNIIRVLSRTILRSAGHSVREKNFRQVLPFFSINTHTEIKLLFSVLRRANAIENFK
jgi:hypothetical protein